MNPEHAPIKNFIANIADKNYSQAEKHLQFALEEKIKTRIRKEIHSSSLQNSSK